MVIMSRARHNTKTSATSRKDGGGSKSTDRGNPAVLRGAHAKTIGVIEGEKGNKRLDRKNGGRTNSDAAEDKAMIKKMVKPEVLKKAGGGGCAKRADGGKTGSDTSPVSDAGGGNATSAPYSSAGKNLRRGGKA